MELGIEITPLDLSTRQILPMLHIKEQVKGKKDIFNFNLSCDELLTVGTLLEHQQMCFRIDEIFESRPAKGNWKDPEGRWDLEVPTFWRVSTTMVCAIEYFRNESTGAKIKKSAAFKVPEKTPNKVPVKLPA